MLEVEAATDGVAFDEFVAHFGDDFVGFGPWNKSASERKRRVDGSCKC